MNTFFKAYDLSRLNVYCMISYYVKIKYSLSDIFIFSEFGTKKSMANHFNIILITVVFEYILHHLKISEIKDIFNRINSLKDTFNLIQDLFKKVKIS